MSEFNSIDDFLGHSGSGGGGGRYLKNWKKKGSIRVWLHTKRLPIASWKHNIPNLVVFEDRDTRETTKAFWGRDMNCWEDELFLKNQYGRDEAGKLEAPPRKCSLCRLIDVVAQAVANGELDWTDEVFRFEGATDSKNDRVIHAGGMTNLFGKKDLSEAQKKQLRAKEIYPSQEWAQNFHAKCQYVLAVVDNDDPGAGVQIASQAQSVGDAIKGVIKDARASLGDEDGNPMVNPFCIELTYDDKAQMNKKYHARRIERIRLTPEIERLIRSDPPDLGPSIRPFNQRALRAFLERYAVVDLPWDRIFDVPVLEAAGGEEDEEESREAAPPPPKEEKKEARGRRPAASPPPPPPASSAKDVATIPCDKCKAPMREDENECRKCGAKYEFDDDAAPEPPKKGKGEAKGDKLPFNRF